MENGDTDFLVAKKVVSNVFHGRIIIHFSIQC